MPEQPHTTSHVAETVGDAQATTPLPQDLPKISALNRAGCFETWEELFGTAPPPRLSVEFMRMALAYEAQCAQAGREEQRSVEKSKDKLTAAIVGRRSPKSKSVSSGSELVREWNGKTHRVRVVVDGYEYAGETYASLSAIAREITGTRWSGPRFFGVKG